MKRKSSCFWCRFLIPPHCRSVIIISQISFLDDFFHHHRSFCEGRTRSSSFPQSHCKIMRRARSSRSFYAHCQGMQAWIQLIYQCRHDPARASTQPLFFQSHRADSNGRAVVVTWMNILHRTLARCMVYSKSQTPPSSQRSYVGSNVAGDVAALGGAQWLSSSHK